MNEVQQSSKQSKPEWLTRPSTCNGVGLVSNTVSQSFPTAEAAAMMKYSGLCIYTSNSGDPLWQKNRKKKRKKISLAAHNVKHLQQENH